MELIKARIYIPNIIILAKQNPITNQKSFLGKLYISIYKHNFFPAYIRIKKYNNTRPPSARRVDDVYIGEYGG